MTAPKTNLLSPQSYISTSKNLANNTPSKLQALALTLTDQALSPILCYENEYGSGELSSNDCIIYHAGSTSESRLSAASTSLVSYSQKYRLDQPRQTDNSIKTHKSATLGTRPKFSRSAAPSPSPISCSLGRCVNARCAMFGKATPLLGLHTESNILSQGYFLFLSPVVTAMLDTFYMPVLHASASSSTPSAVVELAVDLCAAAFITSLLASW